MVRISSITAVLILSAGLSVPAAAQQFQGVESVLESGPVTIEVDGVNARDDRVKSAAERELEANRVYDNGGFHTRSFGGDTHSNRAARSGGNIANILNLIGGDND